MTTVIAGNGGLQLLPPAALIKTGIVDHAEWNYRPLLGWIQRLRFLLIRRLLPPGRVAWTLEVGYGSGIFMPELSSHCEELYGIDVHARTSAVTGVLASYAVRAELFSGSVESLPFEDESFDCIVSVSSLEFVRDIGAAGREMARTLRSGGRLVMVTPGHSPLLDFGLKMMTGESARKDYETRREALMPGLLQHFQIDRNRSFPPATGSRGLYTAFSLRKACSA